MATKKSNPRNKSGQEKRLETLDVKTEKQKQLFLENLGKSSIIQLSCERTGIGRSTYYDWRKKDTQFSKAVELAMKLGTSIINDLAESQLIRAMQNSNMTAIIFWLKNHHKTYNDKIHHEYEIVEPKFTPEQRIAHAKAFFNVGYYTKFYRNEIIREAGGTPIDVPGEEEAMKAVTDRVVKNRLKKSDMPPDPSIEKNRQ